MKITVINGSPRKGNTYATTKIFKNEMIACGEVDFTDFFLPQDMPEFCMGCMSCFDNGEHTCPHAKYTLPILESMLCADAIIFTTPVYVTQTPGAVKAFLDHYGFIFIGHRPHHKMFSKKAFVLATTAAAGSKATIKTITTNMKFWGINRIYSAGFTMRAVDWDSIKPSRKTKYEHKIKKSARRFYKEVASGKKRRPYLFTRMMYTVCRIMVKGYDEATSLDKRYWMEKGLFERSPF